MGVGVGHRSESLALGRVSFSQRRQLWEPPVSGWAPCAHSCGGRSVLHTHLPNRTGQAGKHKLSLLRTWHLKDTPSPAQGLCLLTPCVNLRSHPDPAEGSRRAPSVPPKREERVLSKVETPPSQTPRVCQAAPGTLWLPESLGVHPRIRVPSLFFCTVCFQFIGK